MRFSKMFVAVLSLLTLSACGLLLTPDPEIIIQSPSEGQTFQLGQNVLISWDCEHCELFVDRSLRVILSREDGSQLPFSYDIGNQFLSGTLDWRAGTVQGGIVEPGLYTIIFGAMADGRAGRGYGTYRSGVFRLTR